MLKRKKQQETEEEVSPELKKKSGAKKEPQEEFHDHLRASRRTKSAGDSPLPQDAASQELGQNMVSTENGSTESGKQNNGVKTVPRNNGLYYPKLNTELIPGVRVLKYIGSGSYSTVWRTSISSENVDVERAVKISIGSEHHNKLSEDEIILLRTIYGNQKDIGYKNICSWHGHFLIADGPRKHYGLVFELLPCDLKDHLQNVQTLRLEETQGYFNDILVGLQFLHNTCGIVHADLTTKNILVSNVGNSSREVLKITDFGISFMKSDPPHRLITACSYRAPEAFLCAQIGTASDMWSFACVAFEIVRNTSLFRCWHFDVGFSKELHNHFQLIVDLLGPIEQKIFVKERHNEQYFKEVFGLKGTFDKRAPGKREEYLSIGYFVKYSKMPEWIDQQLVDFLSNILQIHPDRRLTAKQALEHSFMSLKSKNEDSPAFVRFIKQSPPITSPSYVPPSSTNNPGLPRYNPNAPRHSPASPIYDPLVPFGSPGDSPTFPFRTSPTYSLSSSFNPEFPPYDPNVPMYCPASPTYDLRVPTHIPSPSTSPCYSPTHPKYDATSPSYHPSSPSCSTKLPR
ncbi:unnamed protein product [Caenorhabditis brenneri]